MPSWATLGLARTQLWLIVNKESKVDPKIEMVKKALSEKRVLRIWHHRGAHKRTVERCIEVYTHNQVYIEGYCRHAGDKRTFRLDRIENMELLEESFSPDPFFQEFYRRYGYVKESGEMNKSSEVGFF